MRLLKHCRSWCCRFSLPAAPGAIRRGAKKTNHSAAERPIFHSRNQFKTGFVHSCWKSLSSQENPHGRRNWFGDRSVRRPNDGRVGPASRHQRESHRHWDAGQSRHTCRSRVRDHRCGAHRRGKLTCRAGSRSARRSGHGRGWRAAF